MSSESEKRPATGTRTPLREETVARTALALVDSGGLESLTMRRLATALGVQLPALYRLFGNKQELLDEMAEMILAGVSARKRPADGEGWTERLAAIAHAIRACLLTQRDGARIVGGSFAAKRHAHTLTLADTLVETMLEAGFSAERALWPCTTVFSFILGESLEQQGSAHAGDESDIAARTVDHPHLSAAHFLDFDARFDFGLRVLLAGLRAELTEEP